jgi:hypothetical protein
MLDMKFVFNISLYLLFETFEIFLVSTNIYRVTMEMHARMKVLPVLN